MLLSRVDNLVLSTLTIMYDWKSSQDLGFLDALTLGIGSLSLQFTH